jgi:aspartate aminotransferase-like enzyme
MTPGPVEVSPGVLAALGQPTTYHNFPAFIELFDQTTQMLAEVFRAAGKKDVLIMQGEAVLGLEASIANTISPGEKVLVLENGPFGRIFGGYVENAGGTPLYYTGESDRALDADAVGAFLEQNRDAAAVTMVHCETPIGINNPVETICRRAKQLGMLTIVDSVASLAGAEFDFDRWGVDVSVSASQKCVGAPPSLALLAVSRQAWERIEKRKRPLRNSYVSLLDWKETWLSAGRFPYTPFTNDVYALAAALNEVITEGLAPRLERHSAAARQCREGLKGLGLELWPAREQDSSPTVTAFRVPPGKTDSGIIESMVRSHRVLISRGFGELKGTVLRIGTMGYEAQPAFVSRTLEAVADAMR